MNHIIKRGKLGDLEKIVDLNYRIFDGMYENEPYSLEQYQERLKDKDPIIFIVTLGKEIVGDSLSYPKDNSFYLWIMGVDEKYRGKGIGSLLLEKNEHFAKKKNYESILVKVYNVSQAMQQLLKKRGYRVVKTEKDRMYLEKKL